MGFLSLRYFLFFPVVAVCYFLLPQKGRNVWLLLASWFFYLCAGPRYFVFLLGAILLTYAAGLLLAKGKKAWVLALTLIVCIGALFLFKYLGFALSLLERALTAAGLSFQSPALSLLLPAGISFYLFEAMGYVIDVYQGRQQAERNFITYALFLSFFPSLLSGPIGRAPKLLPQFKEEHHPDYDRALTALLRFLWGAFKKLMIADRIAILVNTVYAAPGQFGSLQLFAAAAGFSFQIYCDFSAYSDMAVASAEFMGFTLTQNFRVPYLARSIRDFWRRWHISLSTWFRDYLYFPLGGSRKGRARAFLNVLIVFAVSGLWHGAALTFVVWGTLNGVYQVIGDLTSPLRRKVKAFLHVKPDGKLETVVSIAFTFLLSTAAWVFFKAGSLGQAASILSGIVTSPPLISAVSAMGLGKKEWLALAVSGLVLVFADIAEERGHTIAGFVRSRQGVLWPAAALLLLVAVMIFGVYGTGYDAQSFIYFKF